LAISRDPSQIGLDCRAEPSIAMGVRTAAEPGSRGDMVLRRRVPQAQ
jgi:hypothetical protein